jgi:ATP-binding cassette subfamily B protein
MTMTRARPTLLVPEVMQSSLTDCGPAALKAVLEGFGIDVHYDVLRARCETDVDGTSISALARLGEELGLHSSEVLVSRDSFLLPQARCLPAIVVTRAGGGQLHFIVVWRTLGPWVQIMDPTSGRRWLRAERFLETMQELPIEISQQRFRRWIGSANAAEPLRARLRALGVDARSAAAWLARAQADATHHPFAALDAAVRMVSVLVATGAVATGTAATRFLHSLLEEDIQRSLRAPGGRRMPETSRCCAAGLLPVPCRHDGTLRRRRVRDDPPGHCARRCLVAGRARARRDRAAADSACRGGRSPPIRSKAARPKSDRPSTPRKNSRLTSIASCCAEVSRACAARRVSTASQ